MDVFNTLRRSVYTGCTDIVFIMLNLNPEFNVNEIPD